MDVLLTSPLSRHTPEEAQVDFLAGLLGYKKVITFVLLFCINTFE
jgi:hypothetical protein